ncbi:MAG: alpha-glucan family phosphorylase [Chloroflexota bacterium]
MVTSPTIAYLSMELALDPGMPTYSGGLGILAGDTMRAAADLGLPMVGVTLLHRKGYFRQHLDERGNQSESDYDWQPEELLEPLAPRVLLSLSGRWVHVQAWRYLVRGISGTVPVYFLDTALPENDPVDQGLTDHLYGGDSRYRLYQSAVLGLGGIAMLRALGHHGVQVYHMNEGHSALAPLALLEERMWGQGLSAAASADREAVFQRCVFTTHTPMPAGHDRYPLGMVCDVLGKERSDFLEAAQCCPDGTLDMTNLALKFSRYINGVSMRHEAVSHSIFPQYPINSVSNGVHAATWTSPPFSQLYDRYIPEWRRDNLYLRYAVGIPLGEIRQAHSGAKQQLLLEIERRTGVALDPAALTLGFARRATAYKRSDLLFSDVERLKQIAGQAGPFQVIYGGKSHPRDEAGRALIRRIFQAAEALKGIVPVIYLEEYDMALAKYLCAGVDLWLNTPQKPQEASGTSGMKAALNGVPSLSTMDGWWIEGHVEGVTGWSIGDGWRSESNREREVASLYDKLENVILPMYYRQAEAYVRLRRSAIAVNGSYFNAQRMLLQYLRNAYAAAGELESA